MVAIKNSQIPAFRHTSPERLDKALTVDNCARHATLTLMKNSLQLRSVLVTAVR